MKIPRSFFLAADRVLVMPDVGMTGYGYYVPDEVVTGEEVAEESGIPVDVVKEKMGVYEKRVCPPDDDHCTDMAIKAGEEALADADVQPEELDLVLYHGSEYKDHIVWPAAANIAERMGAENAYATESYTLCGGTPIAMRKVRAQLKVEDIEKALLVTASREEDLVDYSDQDSSFMFNFGSGGGAYVLESDPDEDRTRAWVREGAAKTDGSFSKDVVMPAGGSKHPPSHETVDEDMHMLRVPDPEGMGERLGPVSLPNFLEVADTALERSDYEREDLGFTALVQMKRSFHERVFEELELDPYEEGYYLDEYGHMQSVDQIAALKEGVDDGRVQPGDVVLFLAAGTGYTWSAIVLDWLG
jgi:3-oxoacyl-[acyl-carrier-protein] synthase-3